MHISSSYAKILGGNKFSASGVSPKSVKRKRRRREEKEKRKKAKVGNNNGQLGIANATPGGAHKPPGPTVFGGRVALSW